MVPICFSNGTYESANFGEEIGPQISFSYSIPSVYLSPPPSGTKNGRSVQNYHWEAQYLLSTGI